jgi:hypothetical protein
LWAMFIKGGSIGRATPSGKGGGSPGGAVCGWFFMKQHGKVIGKTRLQLRNDVRGERGWTASCGFVGLHASKCWFQWPLR